MKFTYFHEIRITFKNSSIIPSSPLSNIPLHSDKSMTNPKSHKPALQRFYIVLWDFFYMQISATSKHRLVKKGGRVIHTLTKVGNNNKKKSLQNFLAVVDYSWSDEQKLMFIVRQTQNPPSSWDSTMWIQRREGNFADGSPHEWAVLVTDREKKVGFCLCFW